MLHIDRGFLRLKYPRCSPIEQHLLPSAPLNQVLRRIAQTIKDTYDCKKPTIFELMKYGSLDEVPLDKLVRIMRKTTPAAKRNKKKNIKKEELKGLCRLVMKKLGPAHTEQVYELALSQELYNRAIPHVRQMPVTTRYDTGTTIPSGIIDLEVDHRYLIELKSGPYNDRHRQQLTRYVTAMRSHGKKVEGAMVVCFQTDGSVLFRSA